MVVGFGKSALDRAEEAAQQTSDVTLLFRQAHWPVPQEFPGSASEQIYDQSGVDGFVAPVPAPEHLRIQTSQICPLVSLDFLARDRVGVAPAISAAIGWGCYRKEASSGICSLVISSPHRNIYRLINSGDIRPLQDEIEKFTENGLELKSGKHLIADVVVFGTGWAYDQDILPPAIRSEMDDDGLYLYRHILHPNVPGFAFVGLASTFNNSLSAYLEARWLVAKLKGDLSLPSTVEMSKEIDRLKSWKRKIMPHQASRGSLLQLHMLHYHGRIAR